MGRLTIVLILIAAMFLGLSLWNIRKYRFDGLALDPLQSVSDFIAGIISGIATQIR